MLNLKIDRRTSRLLALPLGMALLAGILVLVILVPRVKGIFFLRRENERLKKELVVLKTKVAALAGLSVPQLEEKVAFSLQVLPVETDTPLLLNTVEQLAGHHGFALKGFSLEDSLLECSLTGEKSNLGPFLQGLNKTLPLLAIKRVKLEGFLDNLQLEVALKPFVLEIEEKMVLPETVALLSEKEEGLLEELRQYFQVGVSRREATPSGGGRSDPFF